MAFLNATYPEMTSVLKPAHLAIELELHVPAHLAIELEFPAGIRPGAILLPVLMAPGFSDCGAAIGHGWPFRQVPRWALGPAKCGSRRSALLMCLIPCTGV